MPKKHTMRKVGNTLQPTNRRDAEWLDGIKDGSLVLIEAKRPRNLKHHCKLFALLHLVCEATDWKEDALLDAIKIELGYCKDRPILGTEYTWRKPKSIAFESMGQDEFEKFYEGAISVMIAHLGIDYEELRNELAKA
tara:strand:- start:2205 stop:2615 length:411 start_codon:yes stop_codon:yes gene_type:complete